MSPQLATCLSILLLLLAAVELSLHLRVVETGTKAVQFSYVGDDHPNTFPTRPVGLATLFAQNTVHMQMSSPTTDREWSLQYPRSGIVYLGPQRRPFMVAMFHQLQCLDVLRRAILRVSPDAGVASVHRNFSHEPEKVVWQTRHCLNYIRQAALCQMDMRTETVTSFDPPGSVWQQDYVCSDWSVLYDEVDKNHDEYDTWRQSSYVAGHV